MENLIQASWMATKTVYLRLGRMCVGFVLANEFLRGAFVGPLLYNLNNRKTRITVDTTGNDMGWHLVVARRRLGYVSTDPS